MRFMGFDNNRINYNEIAEIAKELSPESSKDGSASAIINSTAHYRYTAKLLNRLSENIRVPKQK